MKYSVVGVLILIVVLIPLLYSRINDPDFYVEEISENLKQELITKQAWKPSCPLPLERMKIINVKHYLKDGTIKRNGKFIVLDIVANNTIKMFRELFKNKLIIEKTNYINHYDDHEASLLDNNSLGFVCNTNETDMGFMHSYGTAFDINPVYNPSLKYQNIVDTGKTLIMVSRKSSRFVNRQYNFEMKNDRFVNIFKKHGFSEWGGNWDYNINWQYFSINPFVANIMLSMNIEDGRKFLNIVVKNIKFVNRFDKTEFVNQLKYLYKRNPTKFLRILDKKFIRLKDLTDSQFFDLLRKNINSA